MVRNHLRYYRKRKGLKQRDVAKYLGLNNASRICNWETGRSLPNLKYAPMLAALFKVSLIVLYADLDNQYRKKFHKYSYSQILTINPGTRETGFALFEDRKLVDWGVWTFNLENRLQRVQRAILKIIKRDEPNILLLEKPHLIQQKSSSKFVSVFGRLKKIAKEYKLTVYELDPREVRKTICQEGQATRVKVANLVGGRYLYLKWRLPRDASILCLSSYEKYWLCMFDAIALGTAWFEMNLDKTEFSLLSE